MTFNAPTWSGTKHPMIRHRLGRPKKMTKQNANHQKTWFASCTSIQLKQWGSKLAKTIKNPTWVKLSASQILLLPPWIKIQLPSGTPRISMLWETGEVEKTYETQSTKPMEAGEPRYDSAIALVWLEYARLERASEQAEARTKLWFKIAHIDCRTWIDLVRHNVMSSCSGFSQIQWSHRSTRPVQLTLQWVHHLALHEFQRWLGKSWIVSLSTLPSQSHQSKQLLLWRSQASFEQPDEQGETA